MNQNILIHNSGDCEAGGQMKVSGKGLLVPPFHGRKREKSRVIEEKESDQPPPHPYMRIITFNVQHTLIKIVFIHS